MYNIDCNTFLGSDLKFLLEVDVDGYDGEVDFDVYLIQGSSTLEFHKSQLPMTADDRWIICVDKSKVEKGRMSAKMVLHIPDEDFEDGERTQVIRMDSVAYIR